DPREPATGAPAFDQQRAGDLQQDITDVEQPGPEPEHLIVEAEVAGHPQAGKAYIGAVQVGNQVEEQQERHQPQGHAGHGPPADGGGGAGRRRDHGAQRSSGAASRVVSIGFPFMKSTTSLPASGLESSRWSPWAVFSISMWWLFGNPSRISSTT